MVGGVVEFFVLKFMEGTCHPTVDQTEVPKVIAEAELLKIKEALVHFPHKASKPSSLGGEHCDTLNVCVLTVPSASGNSICEQQCTLVAGRPQCSCSPGLSLGADGRSCEGKELKPAGEAEGVLKSSVVTDLTDRLWNSVLIAVFSSSLRSLVPAEEALLAGPSAADLSRSLISASRFVEQIRL